MLESSQKFSWEEPMGLLKKVRDYLETEIPDVFRYDGGKRALYLVWIDGLPTAVVGAFLISILAGIL